MSREVQGKVASDLTDADIIPLAPIGHSSAFGGLPDLAHRPVFLSAWRDERKVLELYRKRPGGMKSANAVFQLEPPLLSDGDYHSQLNKRRVQRFIGSHLVLLYFPIRWVKS
jgi:hypothetical protein